MRYFTIDSDLIDRSALSDEEFAQCARVMGALQQWQRASRALSDASRRYMHLNESDMRAIRMILRAQRDGQVVTPKDIAHEVGISSASTTKLVDRLEAAGHLVRVPHPTDRRTTCIEVTESTRRSARDTIGRQHARRFDVVAAMSPVEREVAIRFLSALADADVPQGELGDPEDELDEPQGDTPRR
ncbi:MarR family winged helix-turn-helix transcriptional regulator [Microbacterium paludicola]|uniref:MarR family winged helix-turn-helix transcriptional regulator n=1 Tax=Microbacterium paludicola TaxID=300019 RepID=UPI0011A59370|nr:MarR family transcriptional regulator [Microbacterium paludicola]